MKAHLLFRNSDFEMMNQDSYEDRTLLADLEIEYLLENMARKDDMVYEVCKNALLNPLLLAEDIYYRQENLSDVIKNANAVRSLYEIILETEKERKSSWIWFSRKNLSGTFSSATRLLDLYIEMLLKLRLVADTEIDNFQSDGFKNLLSMIQEELDDEYFKLAKSQLKDLNKTEETLISSTMGDYLQGVHYTLRRREAKGSWRRWLFAPSYTLDTKDEPGAEDLEKRRQRAINESANALAQAAENLESFFTMLKRELAFYVGCLNLSETIAEYEMPIAMPTMLQSDTYNRTCKGLYDSSLLLTKKTAIVGNELEARDKKLYLITGANQGGKTTFLRSIGQAQLMAQCGMFACASEFTAPIRTSIFTHFKKEEDDAHTSGKLDEELKRMSAIVDQLEESSLVLLNESFAATNEREGSEINTQITRAFVENQIEVFSVTHLYTYASSFIDVEEVHFLRAQRLDDGTRTFKLEQGKPLATAYGEDLYRAIFVNPL